MVDFDMLIGIGIMLGMCIMGIAALFNMVSQKYPVVVIDVYDRGLKQTIKYRLWGFTIVKDNLFKLLLNEYEVCGDINELEYDIIKGRVGALERRYRAVRRYDYLFAIKQILHNRVGITKKNPEGIDEVTYEDMPLSKLPPIMSATAESDGKSLGMKVIISKEGLLFPFRVNYANEGLQEIEVTNGKGIGARIMNTVKANREYLAQANPLINMLLTVAPVAIIVTIILVGLFLILSNISDDVVKIVEAQRDIAGQLANLADAIRK